MTTATASHAIVLILMAIQAAAQQKAAPQATAVDGGSLSRGAETSKLFLASRLLEDEPSESAETDDDEKFLDEVEKALGSKLIQSSNHRVEDMKKALRPTLVSIEKNEYGKLGHTATRYVLHRLFQARHGWAIKGLDPQGLHFSYASPVQVLEGRASKEVQELFEDRLSDQGFGLEELAVFASVLETMISQETGERLQALFDKYDLQHDAQIPQDRMESVVDAYLAAYILGRDVTERTRAELEDDRLQMPELYSFWKQAQELARSICTELIGSPKMYTFENISDILVQVGERFGQWQNAECQEMKNRLVKLETDEEGCVSLSSFYKGALSSGGADWQFGESLEYLTTNGMVDKSDPQNMKVMVANYLYGQGNCIASSRYYSVCCIDECESLMGKIELAVGAPKASPGKLLTLVSSLSSSTVSANRTLSPTQTQRLYKIAERHGGEVPIHGRLFMQWMHMIYPRECAYPHMSGTTKPLTPDEWELMGNKNSSASYEEMGTFVHAAYNGQRSDQGQCGRWVDEEELFVSSPMSQRRNLHELENDMQTWVATGSVALLCCLAVATVAAIATIKSIKRRFCGPDQALMLV